MGTKEIFETRTNQLFNELGVLHACGEYAGYYDYEAYMALGLNKNLEYDEWCDVMADDKGNQYAIYAQGEITSDSYCEYIALTGHKKVEDRREY